MTLFPKMNSIAIFVVISFVVLAATIVLLIPNPVQAKISFCASGDGIFRDGIFQCFIKENDCKTFSENHPGTKCDWKFL